MKPNIKQAAQDRLSAILRGAFAGSPTPLKEIPKKNGESRGAPKKTKRRGRKA